MTDPAGSDRDQQDTPTPSATGDDAGSGTPLTTDEDAQRDDSIAAPGNESA